MEYPGVVKALLPNLPRCKEGLVSFSSLRDNKFSFPEVGSGCFEGSNFVLMVHPFFRRRFSIDNNFPHSLIDFLWRNNDQFKDVSIALDEDRIWLETNNYLEFDTCYGAIFKEKIASISDGVVKLVQPHDVLSSFYPQYSLYIQWSSNSRKKTFQAEEFYNEAITIYQGDEVYYPSRYIHSEFDLLQGKFFHLDGAIHLYSSVDYIKRRDENSNYNQKNIFHIKPQSKKMFKINDSMELDIWSKLVSLFFEGGPLIKEYFTGQYPSDVIRKSQSSK